MSKITPEKVIEIIQEVGVHADLDNLDFNMDLTLQGFDSLDMMNIYLNLEELYSVKIDDDSIQEEKWSTINKIVANINNEL